jgi:MFS superfamily sulfate permease-like transporter
MLMLAPLLGLLPQATLAAAVIVYSVGLIQPKEFILIRKVRTMEFRWALVACLGVLTLGTLKGILVAIITSMISLSIQAAQPRVYAIGKKRGADVLRPISPEHPDDETFEGLLIVRPEGRIFFVNAESVAAQVRALIKQYQPRVVAFDMSRVPDIEYSALQVLLDLDRRAETLHLEWWLVALNPGVLEVVTKAGLAERLGRERMLFNARAAIQRFLERRASEPPGTPPEPAGTSISS